MSQPEKRMGVPRDEFYDTMKRMSKLGTFDSKTCVRCGAPYENGLHAGPCLDAIDLERIKAEIHPALPSKEPA